MAVRSGVAAAIAAATVAAAFAACNSDTRDPFVVIYDAGTDAEAGATEAGPDLDPTIGGPCTEDAQCDDQIPCTFDRCDGTIARCRNTPDDTQCADPLYCNGIEKCVLREGCVPGPVVTCEDDNGCTIDRCVEETKLCEHVLRDVDGDGDPDDHCQPHADCNDVDPTVSSKDAEICDNGKDDNCNGEVDEQPCATASNDVCATALAVSAPGTFLLRTTAAKKDYTTSCSVANPSAGRDVVLAITVPVGPAGSNPKDVVVRAATSSPSNDVAVSLETTCGQVTSERSCGYVAGTDEARAIARTVAASTTVYAIVTTQSESSVDVTVAMPDGTSAPTNESCSSPAPVPLDTPFTVSLIDPTRDLATTCQPKTGELTYSFTLPEPRDVRIFATALDGPGAPIVSLRSDDCVDELRCRNGSTPPVFARSLGAGTHVFAVSGTSQLDASVVVQTSAATTPPPNQTCAAPPVLVPGTTVPVDLSSSDGAITNSCFPGGTEAAYDLEITQPSDVLVVARIPAGDSGAVLLDTPTCAPADQIACSAGGSDPLRVSKRNLGAGSYRVVVADQKGLSSQLTALVRATAPPVTVTTGTCSDAITIPETGGFFTGDTGTATAKFQAGCDASSGSTNGAKDQILRLVVTQRARFLFDMTDSAYATVLDIRGGAACPGVEVPDECNVGASAGRSYLDVTLDPGTYWVQVDGYNGASGTWTLDVRPLPAP